MVRVAQACLKEAVPEPKAAANSMPHNPIPKVDSVHQQTQLPVGRCTSSCLLNSVHNLQSEEDARLLELITSRKYWERLASPCCLY